MVDFEYYGFFDEDDPELLAVEAAAEQEARHIPESG